MERCDSTTRSILTKRKEKRSRLEQHSLSIGHVFIGVFFVTSTRNHREYHPLKYLIIAVYVWLYLRAIIVEDTAPLKIPYRYLGTIAVKSQSQSVLLL